MSESPKIRWYAIRGRFVLILFLLFLPLLITVLSDILFAYMNSQVRVGY